jgi:TolC family type I secretion outer membrane protein
MRGTHLVISLVCVAVVLSAGGSARAETLKEALSSAYQNNPRLAAQRARVRSTDEGVPQALAGWRPTVTAIGEAGPRVIEQDDSVIGNSSDTLFSRTIRGEIQQPIYRGGRTVASVRSAENTVRADRARLTSVEQAVLLDTVRAYADVVRDQSVVELTVKNEQRLTRQLEATRDRFRVGEVTKTDVFQSEARVARATAERIRAEGSLENSRAAYKNVVGTLPGKLAKATLPGPLPASRKDTVAAAFAGSPDVLAAEYDERASLDNVDRVRGELLPSLSLIGAAERDKELTRSGAEVDSLEAQLRLDVPLYQAGATWSRLRASKQAVSERRQGIDQARRTAEQTANQAWNDLETARAAIKSVGKQVQANQVALDGVQREAEVGARTVLDILDAEQELLDSQVNLVRSERDELVAAFATISAIGALTARSLQLPVEYYDPEVHYQEVRDKWFGGESTGDISGDFNRKP